MFALQKSYIQQKKAIVMSYQIMSRERRVKKLDCLVEIAIKYALEADDLWKAIQTAWKQDKSRCGELTIECRVKHTDYAMFLFTASSGIVSQFPIQVWILQPNNLNLLKHLIANRVKGVLPFQPAS